MDKNKIIILISSALGLVLIGIALSFFLTRDKDTKKETENTTSNLPGVSLPTVSDNTGLLNDLETKYGTTTQIEKDLNQLTNFAVAGGVFNQERRKIVYVEKATGHFYEIDTSGKNLNQISITTIPGVFDVKWSPNGESAILNYFDINSSVIKEDVYSFSVPSFATSTEGAFLPINTISVSTAPDNNRIFYLTEKNPTKGIVSSFENKNQKNIFSLSFGEFLTTWPQTSYVTLLTKPSYYENGYFYKLNTTSGSITKILGDKKGLTAKLSPLINKVLYSESSNNDINTLIYDVDKKTSESFSKTTLPEKCLFSKINKDIIYCAVPRIIPQAKYPNDWYKGLVVFSDTIWKININSGVNELLLNEEDLDIVNMSSNKDEDFLVFQNKKDGTLWSLRLVSSD